MFCLHSFLLTFFFAYILFCLYSFFAYIIFYLHSFMLTFFFAYILFACIPFRLHSFLLALYVQLRWNIYSIFWRRWRINAVIKIVELRWSILVLRHVLKTLSILIHIIDDCSSIYLGTSLYLLENMGSSPWYRDPENEDNVIETLVIMWLLWFFKILVRLQNH